MHRAFRVLAPLAAISITASPFVSARTLASADGRSIAAEVLGFDGLEKVVIKRTDTGQTFTLPISTFAESDQKALRAEAIAEAAKPPALREGDVRLELSRVRFDSRKIKEDITLSSGATIRDAVEITDEDWGYTIALRNSGHREIKGLRADYMLFTEVDDIGGKAGLRRETGSVDFPAIAPSDRAVARTNAITMQKTKLKGGIVWRGTNKNSTRDTLHGIWLRIYRGDELVLESAMPTTLTQTERWAHRDP